MSRPTGQRAASDQPVALAQEVDGELHEVVADVLVDAVVLGQLPYEVRYPLAAGEVHAPDYRLRQEAGIVAADRDASEGQGHVCHYAVPVLGVDEQIGPAAGLALEHDGAAVKEML